MNIPSHYQSVFFAALDQREDVDLKVIYFQGASSHRAAEGWSSDYALKSYETIGSGEVSVTALSDLLEDWEQRIHVISGYFSSALIDLFCSHAVGWCHWSETPGIHLADVLKFNVPLFRILNPFMLRAKYKEGRRIRKHALGAFGQGDLARRSFRLMGVPDRMIADLFYSPSGLMPADPAERVTDFAAGRTVFVAVGALCRRKGIDVLLKAMASLDEEQACLVICGLDRADGTYQRLTEQLEMKSRVLFLGAWPIERIAEVYCASDVFILPSRFDGWGVVLNEAASLGMPLIGTDLCGGSHHVIVEGKNGCRVRAGSVASLGAAMKKYAGNPERIEQEGEVSKARFDTFFRPEKNAARMVAALLDWGAHEG
jgi:glycosyltransferase involved in cell wall biosynthesis